MRANPIGIRILIGAVFICAVGSAIVFQSRDVKTTMNQSPIKVHIYPKNENGQTYGSAADATSYETRPDLISAVGVNGTVGYLLRKDIEGEQPKTPAEAIAIQNSKSPGGRDIPLYDVDGKTVIGNFHIE
ncbi:peptidase M56 BlaR1 [Paenibacillus sp. KN14-4R]|uniref:peptidase M56 BlaR1 n=1 Tax=Paenibacillus sp. KN14-4R TaxID=3445773 RepID=UPI003FA0CB2D